MIRVEQVSSLEMEELAPYRSMRWQHDHRALGIFVVEGEKVVRRLLQSDLTILSLLLPEKWLKEYWPLLVKRSEEITAFTAEKALLEQLTGFSMYQGVLALAKVPRSWTIEELLEKAERPLLLLAVDALSNAENLGGLVRTAAAFGTQGLIVGETSCSPYLRRAVRSSMGTIFSMPVIEPPTLTHAIRQLRDARIRCVAAHPHANRKLSELELSGDCCIVLGSEGEGLSPNVLAACDEAALIPMQKNVDSLNVGTAGAAFLYEVNRQRGRA